VRREFMFRTHGNLWGPLIVWRVWGREDRHDRPGRRRSRGERGEEGGYFDEEFSPPTVRINSRMKRPAARQSRARMAGSARHGAGSGHRLTFVRLIN